MGCRFAGAPDLQAFWKMTLEGRHAFGPPPADRWNAEAFFDADPRAVDKSYAPAGAFLEDVRSFPALTFGISPRRVEVMDPQQRYAMEVALQTIEDAGYKPSELPHRTGVFMGVLTSEYRTLSGSRTLAQLMAAGHFGKPMADVTALAESVENVVAGRPFTAPGVLVNMTAAAVAQELDLHGPAYTTDAACASAIVSIANAVSMLRSGAIDAAVAGGAYICLTPDHHVGFSRIGAMSASGVCRPFDHRADGFVQGDGVATLLLKRVEDAERDGDRIYAVIEGIALNNDGHGDGPMAPRTEGQSEVVTAAWADAKLATDTVGYVEAHGTGTTVGDAAEFHGLRDALGDPAAGAWLGSSKGNIGHTMSAAGVAGMVRAAHAIHHGVIPPMANFEHPKDELGLAQTTWGIPTQAQAWPRQERVAGVSSFGFGGTNGHAVLRGVAPHAQPPAQLELVLMSAPDEASLRALAGQTARLIEQDASLTVAGVARAWAARIRQPARLGVVAGTREDLIAQLAAFGRGERPKGAHIGTAPETPPKIAFLFPGQGAQRPGMMGDLQARFPLISASLARIEQELGDALPLPLTHLIYPDRRAVPVDEDTAEAQLTDTIVCQPALLACSVALTEQLAALGVTPHAVVGHSLGEFTAAAVGGVLDAGAAARFVASRGKAMAALPGDHGAMAAIMAEHHEVEALLVDGAVVANVNHPRQLVISGTRQAVATVVERARALDYKAVELAVNHGFHSPVLAALDTTELINSLDMSDPKVVVASGIADHPYASADEARQVFQRHAISPVMFSRALKQCVDSGADLFLQVGAGGPLAAFARGSLDGGHRGIISLASTDDHDGGRSFFESLARLWVAGADIDVRPIAGAGGVASVLPSVYPRRDYWLIKDKRQTALNLKGYTPRAIVEAPTVAETLSASTSAPGDAPADTVLDRVLGVIAKVSAYPRESLKVTMGLIDDLGFDSLMVNDLATGLADAFPGMGGIPQELLINRPSVQDIVDFARTASSGTAATVSDDDPLDAYVSAWVPAPLPGIERRAVRGHHKVLIVGDTLAAPLAAAFEALGLGVTRCTPAQAATAPIPSLLVWTAGLDDAPPVGAVLAGEAAWPDLAAPLVDTLDAIAKANRQADVIVLRRADSVWAAALAGVSRALAREWTDARVKCVQLDDDLSDNGVTTGILDEWLGVDRTVDVRLGAGTRAVAGFAPAPAADAHPLSPTDVVLITGGTRGIGARLAKTLLPSGATLLLLGRGELSADAAALVAEAPQRVRHLRADVSDTAALRAALGDAKVTVLVHSAGVLADGPLGHVDAATGARARAVKVGGWLSAVAACGPTLRLAVGVGSWAGRFGNRHQAHYAAANALLAELAGAAPRGVRAAVGEFGPWTNSEMVATIPEAMRATMRTEGVDFVGDAPGVQALLGLIEHNSGAVTFGRDLPLTSRAVSLSHPIDAAAQPYLRDHAIDDTPILPLAGAADLLAHASGLAAPFELLDLRLYAGVTAKEPLTLYASADGERMELRHGAKKSLAYRARVRAFTGQAPTPEPTVGGDASPLELATFYDDITFHGPLLQGITAVEGVGKNFIRGRVRTGTPAEWIPGSSRAAWVIDPLVLDSAMQLSAIVAWARMGRAGTPVGIRRYVQLAPFPAGELIAEVRFGDLDNSSDRFEGDIALRALDGALLAVAEGVVAELRQVAAIDDTPFTIDPAWTDVSLWPEAKDVAMRLDGAKLMGMKNPYFNVHDGTARDTTSVEGRELVNFSSYNYLGLSGDPRVMEDVHQAVLRYGTSVSASRVASGERPFHGELEHMLAECQGAEDAILFTAGHATNVTTIGHVMKADDLILHDELIHDSVLQGVKLSGAARRAFRHDDAAHLEQQLRELRRHYKKVLIVVEGVYSMDGDIANLPAFVALKKKYGCLLMVDEAHSFGIIGKTGRGAYEHFGLQPGDVDLFMGTLSKSLASCGGWISGSKAMIQFLKYTAPGFVYSAGLTPANGVAALSSLKHMLLEPERVQTLQANSAFFREELVKHGLDTGPAKGKSAVVPVITGNSMHALLLSQRLAEAGVNVQPIVYPAVADNAARLRFFLSSTHTTEQLAQTAQKAATILAAVRQEFPAV